MSNETITLGAGCFWGVQAILQNIPGVLKTRVGYLGGDIKDPSYEDVCSGKSGHAEVVEVIFDNSKLSLDGILDFFWRLHDPTQINRQGVDIGTQYRSAIFYHTAEQKEIAIKSKINFDSQKIFKIESVTEITSVSTFYPAEDYHQDYYLKKYQGSDGPICHVLRDK